MFAPGGLVAPERPSGVRFAPERPFSKVGKTKWLYF